MSARLLVSVHKVRHEVKVVSFFLVTARDNLRVLGKSLQIVNVEEVNLANFVSD